MTKIFSQVICFAAILILSFACDDDDPINAESDIGIEFHSEFCDAIISGNEHFIETEVNALCVDLLPQSTDADAIGHMANLSKLVERLDQVDCLTASLGCYACIFTLPATSEINITKVDGNITIQYVIDMLTPSEGKLAFAGLH